MFAFPIRQVDWSAKGQFPCGECTSGVVNLNSGLRHHSEGLDPLCPTRRHLRSRAVPTISVEPPHRDEGADRREQEKPGQQRSLYTPLHEAGEVVEHVGTEGERKTVQIRSALARRQDRDYRNGSFEKDRNDEHTS